MASRFENGESITCEANNAVLDHYQEEPQRESVNLAVLCKLGVQVRNVKMVFNIYGTWRRVTFEKLKMKIYNFFYSAKSFSHP